MAQKQKERTRNVACKIRLNDEENNILDKICKKTDSTKSDVMRSALATYYKEMERYFTERDTTSTKTSDILDKAKAQG